ncbi:MAG: class I SAM-dependent methyltransferase, partial [Myxococcota bacterium]|nr:class I SAM-dependent methyltransferase [Myxococcota bacterium]
RDLLRPSHLEGFDAAEEALALAHAKVPEAELYRGDICAPEVRSAPLDLIVSLDVIYIPGAQRARDGLRTLVGALRPGGLFVVNLPAYDWLYSEHDVAIHTSERYTAPRVRRLLGDIGLEVALLTYRVCLLFPLVVMTRLPGMLRARPGDPEARSDLHQPPAPRLDRGLHAVLRAENRLIAAGVRLPWGSSIFAVGRKP